MRPYRDEQEKFSGRLPQKVDRPLKLARAIGSVGWLDFDTGA